MFKSLLNDLSAPPVSGWGSEIAYADVPTNTDMFSWESYDEDTSSLDHGSIPAAAGLFRAYRCHKGC